MKHIIMNPELKEAAMRRYYRLLIKDYFESLKSQQNKETKQDKNKKII